MFHRVVCKKIGKYDIIEIPRNAIGFSIKTLRDYVEITYLLPTDKPTCPKCNSEKIENAHIMHHYNIRFSDCKNCGHRFDKRDLFKEDE